jgi:Fic family protein
VLKAAATAFGFVYIHPFQDGNGRLHRCLIHHVLMERKFTPPGIVFPVSSVMLTRIDNYRDSLQAHSSHNETLSSGVRHPSGMWTS